MTLETEPGTEPRTDRQRGFRAGLVGGLVLGVPAGLALMVAGYPSDELYLWLIVLGVAYAATLAVAVALAPRRGQLAAGLALGATVGIALAPALVVLHIGSTSM